MLSLCLSMILGGFTRICVSIHHPALAASFRDVARLKRTEQGRVALGVTPQSSHRSGRADRPHPPRHLMKSLPARSVVVTWTWIRSRCTWHVSLLRLLRRHPLPFTGSLGSVPPLRRYYEVLRLPAARFAALRFLRLAIPSLRPWFVPSAPDAEPWINRELLGGISIRLLDGNDRVSQVPGGTLVIIRHTPPTPV